jgi:predicted methyltransferase
VELVAVAMSVEYELAMISVVPRSLLRPAVGAVLLTLVTCGCVETLPEPQANPEPMPTSSTAPRAGTAIPVVSDPTITPEIRAVTLAADRSESDKALDRGRRPAETLSFFGVVPGMKVAELGAGDGYTAELLARAVGPQGVVYAQNSRFILERFAERPWTERLAKPVMKNVVRVDREFAEPLPPEAKDLDVVFMVLFYHDTVWMEVDRAKMNKAIFDALRPGGVFAVVDHSAREGTGASEVKTLHRIEERIVREEVQRAGFRLIAEASFLRNPSDPRDWNDSPTASGERRGTSDRFVLKFVKP